MRGGRQRLEEGEEEREMIIEGEAIEMKEEPELEDVNIHPLSPSSTLPLLFSSSFSQSIPSSFSPIHSKGTGSFTFFAILFPSSILLSEGKNLSLSL
jgi:hypothetical protein